MDYRRRINMITAKEAYNKAENKRNEVKEMEMRDIENSIEVASSNGFFRHIIDYAISNEAIEKLKANGYEVTVMTPRGFGGNPPKGFEEKAKTIISWENTI